MAKLTNEIQFGTDGWRAGIAREYTFANVRIVATALATYLQKHAKDKVSNGVAIGFDTRFLSDQFASETADVLAQYGIKVLLADRDTPTPAIAWIVRSQNLAAGVMITASHNPPRYNGFKIIAPDGSPADKDITEAVAGLLGKKAPSVKSSSVEQLDPRPSYFKQIEKMIDLKLLKKKKGSAVCDYVHGSGRGYLDHFLRECDWKVHTIREQPDPMFGGILPDPANPDCQKLVAETVRQKRAWLGLANDPDADRFGITDSDGTYISANQVLCLVYQHLLDYRGLRGSVARSMATTHLLDVMAENNGEQLIETPVGFKWVGDALENKGAIVGGEESGGLSIVGHTPGKDGVLADLLIAEIRALHDKPLQEIYKDITKKYGAYYSARTDLHLQPESKDALMKHMEHDTPKKVGKVKVQKVSTMDGVKLYLQDGSWLLMRPSGTEPVVRVYMEARSKKRLKELGQDAKNLENSI
ncbi:MAG: phosphoglucomutase/phosphomannomutase family protein [Abditibacteriaceae bacterium]